MRRSETRLWTVALLALAGGIGACGEGDGEGSVHEDAGGDVADVSVDADGSDAIADVAVDTSDAGDSGDTGLDGSGDVAADVFDPPEPGSPVVVDLSEYTAGGVGEARVYQVTDRDQLIRGEMAEGLVGDWILENENVRFLVGVENRVISPCSNEGNVLDAEVLPDGPDQPGSGDVMGEVCLMINVGQTFAPDSAEVVESEDGAAILAVTGHVETLEFLNLGQMINDYLPPGLLPELPVDPDRSPPITVTIYYVLRPGDHALGVISGVRNDGDAIEHFAASHMLMSGSTGAYFNPFAPTRGFGYRDVGADNVATAPVSFVAYVARHGGYAYVPRPDPALEFDYPVGGGAVSIAGVTVSTFQSLDVVQLLLTPPARVARAAGFFHLEPGRQAAVAHRIYAGDGPANSMVDLIWTDLGVETGAVRGRVVDADGNPVGGARVTALNDDDRAMNQTWSGDDGTFEMLVPVGDYVVRARTDGGFVDSAVTTVSGETSFGELDIPRPARLTFEITDAAGQPTPARVSVLCDGDCLWRADSRELDTDILPPGGWERVVNVGADGQASIELGAGDYRVVVSRGSEWSVWPADAIETGGEAVSLSAGDVVNFPVEIAQVVNTAGAVSGDFHVHAMASSDSNVSFHNRVLNFMAEGVDVLISTDHDSITDYAPVISELGAQQFITSIVGDEITTPNIGHFNAFPVVQDTSLRRGGPIDWSNGPDYNLPPADLYAAIDAYPGEQVIQVNHPNGTIGALKLDPLTGHTFAVREDIRMAPAEPDPVTGDTGLWSDNFTAMEIMNGNNMGTFNGMFRWWLTFVGRGFSPTATAVTDTHSLYSDLGGVPRSWIFTGAENDELSVLDVPGFVTAVNEGRLIGSNGPFFRAELENDGGDTAGFGETVAVGSGTLTLRVAIEIPAWMDVDTIDVYSNVSEDLYSEPGTTISTPLEPTLSHVIDWDTEGETFEITGTTGTHEGRRAVVEIPISIESDAYVVVVVRDAIEPQSMYPVMRSGDVHAFAFANPIFVDVDGGGYNNFPLSAVAALRATMPSPFADRGLGEQRPAGMRPLTLDDIETIIERGRCSHAASQGSELINPLHRHNNPLLQR